MVEINRKAWLVLDVVGVIVLLIGVIGFVGLIDIGETASTVVFGIGVFLIIESAVFIYLEGLTIRTELQEIEESKKLIDRANTVSDSSDENYILDLTKEPEKMSEQDEGIMSESKEVSAESYPEDDFQEEVLYQAEDVESNEGKSIIIKEMPPESVAPIESKESDDTNVSEDFDDNIDSSEKF